MQDDSPTRPDTRMGAHITRRTLLKMALGAGLVAAVQSCAPSNPPAAQPTSAPAAPAAQPTFVTGAATAPAANATTAPAVIKPSGTLTIAVGDIGAATYIPSRMGNQQMPIAVSTFGESLLDKNDDMSVRPQLAEKWSMSPDGKVITFDLKKGTKFTDGTELTSADVKWTFEQAALPDSTNVSPAEFRIVDHIDTPSPYQVILYLKSSNALLQYKMAGPGYETQVMVSKANVDKLGVDAAGSHPVGTGPWKFVEYKSGESVRFQAVENHWRKTPAFQELVYVQVPEESTRLAMVLKGQADLTQLSMASLKPLQDGGGNAIVDKFVQSNWITLGGQYLPSRKTFDPKVPWVADPADKQAWDRALKVRQAMNIAVDRKTIVDTLFAGQGAPATYLYAIPGGPFSDASWNIPYDPERAKQLLSEAGYPNGFDLPLWLVEDAARPGTIEIGQAVGQYWQAIGLRPQLQKKDYTGAVRPGVFARTLSGIAYSWAGYFAAEPVVSHYGGFGTNAGGTHGPEYPPLDDLITKALATVDYQERKKIELQMGQMVLDQSMVVPVAYTHGLWGASKKIKSWPRIPGLQGPYNFEYIVPA